MHVLSGKKKYFLSNVSSYMISLYYQRNRQKVVCLFDFEDNWIWNIQLSKFGFLYFWFWKLKNKFYCNYICLPTLTLFYILFYGHYAKLNFHIPHLYSTGFHQKISTPQAIIRVCVVCMTLKNKINLNLWISNAVVKHIQ